MTKKKASKPVKMTNITPNAVVVRGKPEWREWLKRAAAHEQSTMAEFLDRAARLYAKKIGFTEGAPDR
jgi:uncharacterized protein (DUF1778 family)